MEDFNETPTPQPLVSPRDPSEKVKFFPHIIELNIYENQNPFNFHLSIIELNIYENQNPFNFHLLIFELNIYENQHPFILIFWILSSIYMKTKTP